MNSGYVRDSYYPAFSFGYCIPKTTREAPENNRTPWTVSSLFWSGFAEPTQPGKYKAPHTKFNSPKNTQPRRDGEIFRSYPGPGRYNPQEVHDRRQSDLMSYTFASKLPSMFNPSVHVDPLNIRKNMTAATVPWTEPTEWPARMTPPEYKHVGPVINKVGDVVSMRLRNFHTGFPNKKLVPFLQKGYANGYARRNTPSDILDNNKHSLRYLDSITSNTF